MTNQPSKFVTDKLIPFLASHAIIGDWERNFGWLKRAWPTVRIYDNPTKRCITMCYSRGEADVETGATFDRTEVTLEQTIEILIGPCWLPQCDDTPPDIERFGGLTHRNGASCEFIDEVNDHTWHEIGYATIIAYKPEEPKRLVQLEDMGLEPFEHPEFELYHGGIVHEPIQEDWDAYAFPDPYGPKLDFICPHGNLLNTLVAKGTHAIRLRRKVIEKTCRKVDGVWVPVDEIEGGE